METEQVVGWFTLAMIISGFAGLKNRSEVAWFIGGAIFGPLALCCLIVFCDTVSDESSESENDEFKFR